MSHFIAVLKLKVVRDRLFKILWGRPGRNIIFWTLFLGEWIYNVPVPKEYAAGWYWLFRIVFWLLMAGLTYFNTLFLIPKLLTRKRYWFYILSIIAFTYFIAFCIALSFNVMMHQFPKMHIENVSFITTDVPLSYTWSAMMEGAKNYFFFMLEWVCVFNMVWYLADYARQQKVIDEAKKKQVDTELAFLKGQMNPHFLFNTLNNLYGLALKKSEQAPEAILKLSSILRYLLYESDIKTVSFEKEKEVMNAYIDLELLRLQDSKNLHFHISADKEYNIPPLLWLQVLENAFKHATRVITDNYFIEYHFDIKDSVLEIYSKNNYKPALNGEVKEKVHGGLGLENLKKRLELLFPGKYSLTSGAGDFYYVTEVKVDLS